MTARLVLTDGTTTVNLLGNHVYLREWRPATAGYKDGGLYADSPLADGRRLVDRRFENSVETFELVFSDSGQDVLIRWTQDLRRLLEKAADYWSSAWADGPVWLEARASAETNTRYALVISGRLESDDSPYRQPFLQPYCRAVMDEMTLLIERDHWQEAQPGVGACMPLLIRPDYDNVSYLEELLSSYHAPIAVWPFNETAGTVARNYSQYGNLLDGGYTAGMMLADLLFSTGEDVAFVPVTGGAVNVYTPTLAGLINGDRGTFLMWMRSSGLIWNDGNDHYLLYLYEDAGNYITVRKTTTDNQIRAEVMNDGVLRAATGTVPPLTSDWVSIAFRWTVFSQIKLTLFINGVAVGVNFVPFPGGDININTAIIGAEDLPGGSASPGLSSHIAYAALWGEALPNFAIWPLMALPDPVSDTTTCDGVFVANKRSEAAISHLFVFDTSLATFSSNGVTHDYTAPFPLMPAPTPASGDILYIGSSTTTVPAGGPFSSVIFNLLVEGYDCLLGTWEYWSGAAWTALTVFDHTDVLDVGDVVGVFWMPPTNWAATTINSVSAYWVRLRLTGGGGACDPPYQVDWPPYAAIRPYIEAPAASIPGDIPAQVALTLQGLSDGAGGLAALPTRHVVAGLRSLERGPDFTAYINLADVQNPAGITVAAGTNTSFIADNRAPAGRSAVYNPAGAEALAVRATVTIDQGLAHNYRGLFRIFLRGLSGGTTTWTARVTVQAATDSEDDLRTIEVEWIGGSYDTIDLGLLALPPGLSDLNDDEQAGGLVIEVEMSASVGTSNFNLYDLILMPADEAVFTSRRQTGNNNNVNIIGYSQYGQADGHSELLVDGGVYRPKSGARSILRLLGGGEVIARWTLISGPTIPGQANAGQRWWFLFSSTSEPFLVADPAIAMRVRGQRQARYLSMRGNR